MRLRRLHLAAFATLGALALVFGVAFAASLRAEADTGPVVHGRATTTDKAVQAAGFYVGRPTWLPFAVQSSFGMTNEIGGTVAVEQTFVGMAKSISLTAVRGPLELQSEKYPVQTVRLASGTPARLLDNGRALLLVWSSGGTSYQVAALSDDTRIPVADLIRVANSIR